MTDINRRRLLGGLVIAVGGSGAYCALQRDPETVFEAWTPEPETWPLFGYDTANTAHNPNANPPRREPERTSLASIDSTQGSIQPLVGDSRTVLYGSNSVVSLGDDGRTTIADVYMVECAGIGPDGRVHVVQSPADGGQSILVGYDGTTEAYRATITSGHPDDGLIVGRDGVCVSTTIDTVAIEPSGRTWTVEGEVSALADGRLYTAVGIPGLIAHTEPTDSLLDTRLKRVWETEMVLDETHPPAVTDDRLVLSGSEGGIRGQIAAYDVETGDQLWTPRILGRYVSSPAVVNDRAYTAVYTEDPRENPRSGRVVALDLSTGETVWSDETGWHALHPAVGGDTLVVVGVVYDEEGDAIANKVRAYDAASGDVLWTETFESENPTWTGRALVGKRILVGLGNTLYELA